MNESFYMFDPARDDSKVLPDIPGNYLVVLRPSSELPPSERIPEYHVVSHAGKEYRVIYVGISREGIRKRDYKQHFTGNAGSSTLRKSLGSLMGLAKVPRNEQKPEDGKTKFSEDGEAMLSRWMKENLLLLYSTARSGSAEIRNWELQLIAEYNPPLNIQDNDNPINWEYRKMLQNLRKQR